MYMIFNVSSMLVILGVLFLAVHEYDNPRDYYKLVVGWSLLIASAVFLVAALLRSIL